MAGYAPDTETSTVDAWHHDARCRPGPGIDAELWHPAGSTGPFLLQIEEAKAECRQCPVMQICGETALARREPAGVWGGMSEDERSAIIRRLSRHREPRPPKAECGTDAAYRRHSKNGEHIDERCRAAHNAAQLAHYHANKVSA